jgi:antitoxin VapB
MAILTTAKLFQHGGSQAVRLPKAFRLTGSKVKVSRTARGILLEPLVADAAERQRKFFALAGSCPDLADVPPHAAKDIPRD